MTVAAVLIYLQTAGYTKNQPKITLEPYDGPDIAVQYPDTSFAVLSDIHFYDVSLGTTGAAFEKKLLSDRKMLVKSEELLDSALERILASNARFVLISGDLTKDGEALNHKRVSEKLQRLVDSGIKVYVTPGNHDVNNFEAVRYVGDEAQSVDNISAGEFAEIYYSMGYGEAIMRDAESLSYVAEPVSGLWLLALDSCRYEENTAGHTVTGGRIRQGTAKWTANVLNKAVAQNKAVIVLMHHGVVEHWNGQARLHPNYLVKDYRDFGEFLASYQVRLAFTGHYHAQSIVRADFGADRIYDAETGSLVTYPSPVRYCEIRGGVLAITTDTLSKTEAARDFVKRSVARETVGILSRFMVSEKDADYLADAVSDAFVAHYAGDADIRLWPEFDPGRLSLWGRVVYATQKYILDGLWTDLPPADNNVIIDLN